MISRTTATGLATALGLFVPGGAAQAHPHVFVEARSEVVFDADRRVTGIRHVWQFDEAFTAFAVQGLDADGDGKLTREELQPLAQINVESLAEYDFFTYLQRGDQDIDFGEPEEYWLDFYGGKLTLFYTLPLAQPLVMDASKITLEVFDPTYFVAFEMSRDTPFELVSAPASCSLDFTPPPELDPQTATTLDAIPQDQREPSADLMTITETLSNTATIACK